jgi:hypothetical protein
MDSEPTLVEILFVASLISIPSIIFAIQTSQPLIAFMQIVWITLIAMVLNGGKDE